MQILILCGGLGTRLRPITNKIPKPMVEVHGKPFLEHLLEYYKKQGVTDFVFAVGYLKDQIREYFGDGKKYGIRISYSEETTPLGTGGAIKNASSLMQEIFFVANGDTFIELDLKKMLFSHKKHKSICTIGVRGADKGRDMGLIEIDKNDNITKFGTTKEIKNGLVNSGIYLMDKKVLEYIPNGKISLENDIFAKKIFPIRAHHLSRKYFVDIGTFETYDQFIREFDKTPLCHQ